MIGVTTSKSETVSNSIKVFFSYWLLRFGLIKNLGTRSLNKTTGKSYKIN